MPRGKDKPKPRRKSFLERMKDRLREAAGLGRVLVNEPGAFPGELGRVFLRFVRTLWQARGGGLYACGFIITFLWLEAKTLVEEVAASTSLAGFFTEQFFEFIFRFTVQSVVNTVGAFIWPVYVIQLSPMWGGIGLAALWILFPRFVEPRLTRWLFQEEGETPASQEGTRRQ